MAFVWCSSGLGSPRSSWPRMTTVSGEGGLPSTEAREISTLSGRRQKRQRKSERYHGGQARIAYKQHDGDLSRSLTDDSQLSWVRNPCLKKIWGECSACHYQLQKLGKAFNDIGRHGKERSNRCRGYPDPRKSNTSVGTLEPGMFSCQNWQLLFNVFCHFWQPLASIFELILSKYCQFWQ